MGRVTHAFPSPREAGEGCEQKGSALSPPLRGDPLPQAGEGKKSGYPPDFAAGAPCGSTALVLPGAGAVAVEAAGGSFR